MVLIRINNYSLVILVLVLLLSYLPLGIMEELSDEGTNQTSMLEKDGVRIKTRKHLVVNAMLDYDDAGANPKHDPRKGKPGGGKNP